MLEFRRVVLLITASLLSLSTYGVNNGVYFTRCGDRGQLEIVDRPLSYKSVTKMFDGFDCGTVVLR